ncbi:aminopeptidase P family protein [Commensalibacter sp. Nvir]|uniref:aminopeptidase P family protein n=1 Tax=Commensalibacter sp. Nvir TaxID=3069817 RepID=UPI0030C8443A
MNRDKIEKIRHFLVQQELDGFVIKRGDEYLNEYVAPYAERLAWLTGFTGSAGLAILLQSKGAVFSDGRYILPMSKQLDPQIWQCFHNTKHPPKIWLLKQFERTVKLGYDPKLMSVKDINALSDKKINLIPLKINPIDQFWLDKPKPPSHPILSHSEAFTGQTSEEKLKLIRENLKSHHDDAYILCDPTSVSWLLNIRGSDVPYTPIPLVYAIINQKNVFLYAEKQQYTKKIRQFLNQNVIFRQHQQLEQDITSFKKGSKVGYDLSQTSVWFKQLLEEQKIVSHPRPNPCLLLKAKKNNVEQEGARTSHRRDALALCRFFYWLEKQGQGCTENDLAQKLIVFRKEISQSYYKEESFPAIVAVGKNAAIIHYQPSKKTASTLTHNNIFLIDSGGQYCDGTTDVTRTLWYGPSPPPPPLVKASTLVLKGHIALAKAIFPKGTIGSQLDSIARYSLWQNGLNYDHGTGHGVGSFLSVHEGPCGISTSCNVPLEEGMILSNEPGYYLPGQFGIRHESLLLVVKSAYENYLMFEPLTLVPFDKKIIDKNLLTEEENRWLTTYHQRIYETLSPMLSSAEQLWLKKCCSPFI